MEFELGQIISIHAHRHYVVMDKSKDKDGVILYSLIDTHSAEKAEMKGYTPNHADWYSLILPYTRSSLERWIESWEEDGEQGDRPTFAQELECMKDNYPLINELQTIFPHDDTKPNSIWYDIKEVA